MAAFRAFCGLFATLTQRSVVHSVRHPAKQVIRTKVSTGTGGIVGEPERVPFGLIKVVAVTTPFLYLGAKISEKGAALLEELDIFVPEDDDD